MAEADPPITDEDVERVVKALGSVERVVDLGVRVLRTWLGTAVCEEHGPISDERVAEMHVSPSEQLPCPLCRIRYKGGGYKQTTWRVLRGG